MYKFIYIFIILYFFQYFTFLNSFYLNEQSNQCYDKLVKKLGIEYYLVKNATGYYDYCTFYYCTPDGSIKYLYLSNGLMYDNSNVSILSSDVTCFPDLTDIYLNGFNISKDLFYFNFPNKMKSFLMFSAYTDFIDFDQKVDDFDNLGNPNIPYYIKLSDFAHLKTLGLNGFYFYLDNDVQPDSTNLQLNELSISINNYPNLSSLVNTNSLVIYTSKNFDYTTLSNFSTIATIKPIKEITITSSIEDTSIPHYYTMFKGEADKLIISSNFEKPISMIDISNLKVKLLDLYPGPLFSFNNRLPLLPNPLISLTISQGNFSILPSPTDFGQSTTYNNCSLIDTLPIFNGTGLSYSYPYNKLQGTVDSSWCSTKLNVLDSNLTGVLPSCFTCYLSENEIYASFYANSFTNNMDRNQICTTFAPRVIYKSLINGQNSSFEFTGIDIGFYPNRWKVLNSTTSNEPIEPLSYDINTQGKNYTVYYNTTFSNNYFTIQFEIPNPSRIYTFPITKSTPLITNVDIKNNNELSIGGNYFSTYLGYSIQNVQIFTNNSYIECLVSNTSFFLIDCNISSNLPNGLQLLKVVSDSLIGRVLINNQVGISNDLVCPNNNCLDLDNNKVCDLSTGTCKTWYETCEFNCGSFGECDHSTGKCNCDSNHQGNDCTIPFIECINSCSNQGQCNNKTGECLCDINYTSNDCSIPNQYISSITVSTTSGGEASFNGWFGNIHNNLVLTIGGKQCIPITLNSTNEIKCMEPIGTGIQNVVLSQNGINYKSPIPYEYSNTIKKCPNDCTNLNQGICNTTDGTCNCINGYTLFDCSIKGNNNNGGGNSSIDPNTGGSNIGINFQIYLKSLLEIDYSGNIVNQYSLQSNWIYNKTQNDIANLYTFTQSIQNSNCNIKSTVEEVTNQNGKIYSFAGTTFKLNQGSIKYSILIENYKYSSNLNTLQLELVSSAIVDGNDDKCNSPEIDINNVDNQSTFNYIKISKDNKVFSGRFINRILLDGKSTFFTSSVSNDSNSIIVSLNLGHCSTCLIDPDFSVLIDTDFKSKCSNDNSNRKWLIPIAVVVPVVGVAILITIGVLLYKKRFIEAPLKLKMKSFSRNNI